MRLLNFIGFALAGAAIVNAVDVVVASDNCVYGTKKCDNKSNKIYKCQGGKWFYYGECPRHTICYFDTIKHEPACVNKPKEAVSERDAPQLLSAEKCQPGEWICKGTKNEVGYTEVVAQCIENVGYVIMETCKRDERCVTKPNHKTGCEREQTLSARQELLCEPGHYVCMYHHNKDNIYVCDASGHWKLSAECGKLGSCDYDSNHIPYCIGNKAAREEALPARRDTNILKCVPGGHICKDHDGKSNIYVCEAQKHWHLSTVCGNIGCCIEGLPGSNTAHCTCSADTTPDALIDGSSKLAQSKKIDTEVTITEHEVMGRQVMQPLPCTIGQYFCRHGFLDGSLKSMLVVCIKPDGTKALVEKCGEPGCCKQGPTETAHCACKVQAIENKTVDEAVNKRTVSKIATLDVKPRQSLGCKPGLVTCGSVIGTDNYPVDAVIGCTDEGIHTVIDVCMNSRCDVKDGVAVCIDHSSASIEAKTPSRSPVVRHLAHCTPGHFSCGICIINNHGMGAVLVGAADSTCLTSAICERADCCISGPVEGTAYCACKGSKGDAQNGPEPKTIAD